VKRDVRSAARWFRSAAEAGDAEAQAILGTACTKAEVSARTFRRPLYGTAVLREAESFERNSTWALL